MKIVVCFTDGADRFTNYYPANARGMRQAQMDIQTWKAAGYSGTIYDPRKGK